MAPPVKDCKTFTRTLGLRRRICVPIKSRFLPMVDSVAEMSTLVPRKIDTAKHNRSFEPIVRVITFAWATMFLRLPFEDSRLANPPVVSPLIP